MGGPKEADCGVEVSVSGGWKAAALPRMAALRYFFQRLCALIERMLSWQSAVRIILTFLLGLCFDWLSGPRWSSWPETLTSGIFVILVCFLVGMSVGGASRGPDARASVVAFALAFLVWPAFNGMPRQLPALLFFGLLEVLPTFAGGVTGMILRRSCPRAWWVIAAAVGAVSITAVGPRH
jgi:hypothetical protein